MSDKLLRCCKLRPPSFAIRSRYDRHLKPYFLLKNDLWTASSLFINICGSDWRPDHGPVFQKWTNVCEKKNSHETITPTSKGSQKHCTLASSPYTQHSNMRHVVKILINHNSEICYLISTLLMLFKV